MSRNSPSPILSHNDNVPITKSSRSSGGGGGGGVCPEIALALYSHTTTMSRNSQTRKSPTIIRPSQGYVPNVPRYPSHVPRYPSRPKPNVPESSSDVPRNIRNVPESGKSSQNRQNRAKIPENRPILGRDHGPSPSP